WRISSSISRGSSWTSPNIGAWQIELRKVHDDPLEMDELILHVQKINGTEESAISAQLSERCFNHLEIKPNRIVFHTAAEIRRLQGVGELLKEQKIVDHRPPVNGVVKSVSTVIAPLPEAS